MENMDQPYREVPLPNSASLTPKALNKKPVPLPPSNPKKPSPSPKKKRAIKLIAIFAGASILWFGIATILTQNSNNNGNTTQAPSAMPVEPPTISSTTPAEPSPEITTTGTEPPTSEESALYKDRFLSQYVVGEFIDTAFTETYLRGKEETLDILKTITTDIAYDKIKKELDARNWEACKNRQCIITREIIYVTTPEGAGENELVFQITLAVTDRTGGGENILPQESYYFALIPSDKNESGVVVSDFIKIIPVEDT